MRRGSEPRGLPSPPWGSLPGGALGPVPRPASLTEEGAGQEAGSPPGLTEVPQLGVELVPQGPEDQAQLLRGAAAERSPVHVTAREVNGAGVILVLLHLVADPVQDLGLGPELGLLSQPAGLLCKGPAQRRVSPLLGPAGDSGGPAWTLRAPSQEQGGRRCSQHPGQHPRQAQPPNPNTPASYSSPQPSPCPIPHLSQALRRTSPPPQTPSPS